MKGNLNKMYTTFTCPNCKEYGHIQEKVTMTGNYYKCEKCNTKFTLRIEVLTELKPFDEDDAILYREENEKI